MTDLDKRFLTNTDETGRFIVKSLTTGKKYYIEPIGNPADWGDINPATKKVEGDYGQKYTVLDYSLGFIKAKHNE